MEGWLHRELLCSKVPYVHILYSQLRVCDVWHEGCWQFDLLFAPIQVSLKDEIERTHVWLNGSVADQWVCVGATSGIF